VKRRKFENKNDYIQVLVEPSYKRNVQKVAEDLGVSMGTVMRMSFNFFQSKLDDSDLKASDGLISAFRESKQSKNLITVKGNTVDDLMTSLNGN